MFSVMQKDTIRRYLREFLLFFCIQIFSYSILTVNFRAVANGNLLRALITDGVNAAVGFFVIRKIAKSDDSIVGWAGYVAGSLIGTTIGMSI